MTALKRRSDAEPCDVVIIDEYVFGVKRCNAEAIHTIDRNGQEWRICVKHAPGQNAS